MQMCYRLPDASNSRKRTVSSRSSHTRIIALLRSSTALISCIFLYLFFSLSVFKYLNLFFKFLFLNIKICFLKLFCVMVSPVVSFSRAATLLGLLAAL